MKSIISKFNLYNILNKKTYYYLLYLLFIVFINSIMYHYPYSEVIPFSQKIIYFIKYYLIEIFFSLLFLFIFSFIFNIYFNNKSKVRLSFFKIFNLFCSLYTILFILDIIFSLVLGINEISDLTQTIYSLLSVLIGFICFILVPIVLKLIINKNILFENLHTDSFVNRHIIINLLLMNSTILDDINNTPFYKILLNISFFSLLYTYVYLRVSPYVLNLSFEYLIEIFTIEEIISTFLDLWLKFTLYNIFISFIVVSLVCKAKIKIKLINICKFSLCFSCPIFFICLILVLAIKLNSFTTIALSTLANQILLVLLPLILLFSLIYINIIVLPNYLKLYFNDK